MGLDLVDIMGLYAKALMRVGYLEYKIELLEKEVNNVKKNIELDK